MNNEVIKSNGDLVVGKTDYDPMGNMIYEPGLGKLALWYGFAGGSLFGILAYVISSGTIPVRDFGQFATSGNGVATFVGTIIGIAIGGLTGSLIGLKGIVHYNSKMKKVNNKQK